MTQESQPDTEPDDATSRVAINPTWVAGVVLLMCTLTILRVVAALSDSDVLEQFGQRVTTTDRLVFVGDAAGGSELGFAVALALIVGGLVLSRRDVLTGPERVALLVLCALAAAFAVLDAATAVASLVDEEQNPVQRYYMWSRRARHALGFLINAGIAAGAFAVSRRFRAVDRPRAITTTEEPADLVEGGPGRREP